MQPGHVIHAHVWSLGWRVAGAGQWRQRIRNINMSSSACQRQTRGQPCQGNAAFSMKAFSATTNLYTLFYSQRVLLKNRTVGVGAFAAVAASTCVSRTDMRSFILSSLEETSFSHPPSLFHTQGAFGFSRQLFHCSSRFDFNYIFCLLPAHLRQCLFFMSFNQPLPLARLRLLSLSRQRVFHIQLQLYAAVLHTAGKNAYTAGKNHAYSSSAAEYIAAKIYTYVN